MTETDGLLKVREAVARALRADSGATLETLMGDILDVLVDFDLDPVAAFGDPEDFGEAAAPRPDNVVPLRPWLH
jgi:hypothetical protein